MRRHDANALPQAFRSRFDGEPRFFRAPGRVNLIGEHTDYNDGFVLPAALDLATYVAIAPRRDSLIRVHSVNLDADVSFDLAAPQRPSHDWTDYIRGVAVELSRSGYQLRGADLAVLGTFSMGSGLSASAALEVAFGFAMLSVSEVRIDRLALAKICQRAENEFVGMRCGIMDQFISCHGVEGAALLLDCRSLDARAIPIDASVRIVVCNTMVHHELASSAFNQRRSDCEEAVRLLAPELGAIQSLRDVMPARLEAHRAALPDLIFRRARHVVSENRRVIDAVAALEQSDFAEAGRLMNASHQSLRDDYEVSCKELDLMVELARQAPGVHGARMTGGGFGGCTVSLVDAGAAEAFADSVGPAYREATGLTPTIFSCYPGAGAGPVFL
jgi:galactokinase